MGRRILRDENNLLLRLLPLVGGKPENITPEMAEAVMNIVSNRINLETIRDRANSGEMLPRSTSVTRHELKLDIDRDLRFLGLLDIAPQAKRLPGRPPKQERSYGVNDVLDHMARQRAGLT